MGKTNLKCLLLDHDPPQRRNSTSCAEAPVRIEIRNVTKTKVQTVAGRWHDVDNKGMFDVVAEMILVAEPESPIEIDMIEEVHEQPKPSNTILSRIHNWMKRNSKPTNTHSNEEGATSVPHTSPQPISSNVSDACQKAMDVIIDKLVQCIMKAKGQMTTADISRMKQNLKLRWVYFTDSGGQPEYHELLPLFVRRISSAVCVVPLPNKLDETQDVEYFQNGQRIGDVQQSQFTEKDTVKCLFNTIESYSTQEEPPKVMVVGTYFDKLKELQQESTHAAVETDLQLRITTQSPSEMLEEKDRQVREFLERDFPNQLVYYSESSTTKKLIFPVNTLSRGEHEKAVAESIRCSIESSGAMEENVPIWWYIMELLLQELAKELGRGVLSRAECLQMASLLNITEDAFHDALVYFDELNVLPYLPNVLPNVVFVESQIPLDKVSELVFHSYYLRQPTPAMSEEWRHFRDRGVVTVKCLEHFPRHYVQDVFSADDLCKFLQQRLVLAPIPKPRSSSTTSKQVQQPTSDQPSSSTPAKEEPHYVMPALWRTLPEAELDSRRISSPVAATLLVRFPRGFRRAGVFCCFTVHLIRCCGWDLLLETDQQLYRNCIKLRLLSSPPVTVVLIDSNSYIEVHVNTTTGIPVDEYAGLLPIIKETILSGIFAACRALNYKQTKPHLTFYCPHTLPSTSTYDTPKSKVQHTATLTPNRKYWRCDLDPDVYFGQLEDQHTIWFGLPQGM